MKPINPSTLFEDAAARCPLVHLDRPFDIAPDGGVTYGVDQLAELVRDAAGWLYVAGARCGDRVAIVKGNHWDIDVLAYAAVRIGALPAKIRDNLSPEAIQILLERLEPAVLVTTAQTLEAASRAGVDLAALAKTTLSIDRPAPGVLSLDNVRGQAPPPPHRRGDDEPLDSPFRNVRVYISSYDAIHPPAVRAFLAASQRPRAVFVHVWGQSETGPMTFRLFTRRALAARGNRHPTTRDQGLPTPGKVRLRVVDPKTFRALPPGQPGVIMARTKARCRSYLGEQQRWDEKADGRWFNTGDIGAVTRKGRVVFLDREVDAVPGISCVEIEDVIDDRLAEVLECVVLGTPGRPPLPVVITGNGRLDATTWRAAVQDLPALAEPVVLTWDQVPRTGKGKVRRLALREQLAGVGATYGTGRWT